MLYSSTKTSYIKLTMLKLQGSFQNPGPGPNTCLQVVLYKFWKKDLFIFFFKENPKLYELDIQQNLDSPRPTPVSSVFTSLSNSFCKCQRQKKKKKHTTQDSTMAVRISLSRHGPGKTSRIVLFLR